MSCIIHLMNRIAWCKQLGQRYEKKFAFYAAAWLLLAAVGTASGAVRLGISQSDG